MIPHGSVFHQSVVKKRSELDPTYRPRTCLIQWDACIEPSVACNFSEPAGTEDGAFDNPDPPSASF